MSSHPPTALAPRVLPAPSWPANDGAQPGLHIRHDAIGRGGRVVLEAGELTLPAGCITGLVGANGAGKSTLLLALAGLLRLPRGAMHATLHTALQTARHTTAHTTAHTAADDATPLTVGIVPQQPTWPPWLRVHQATALLGVDAARLAAEEPALALAPLLDRRASALSAGQAQTLAMACALTRDDPLLLLDEPFAGVDLARRRALRHLLARARQRRPALVAVLSSHAAAELLATCDWLVALRDGRYVHAGPTHALLTTAGIDPTAPDAVARFESRLAEMTM